LHQLWPIFDDKLYEALKRLSLPPTKRRERSMRSRKSGAYTHTDEIS